MNFSSFFFSFQNALEGSCVYLKFQIDALNISCTHIKKKYFPFIILQFYDIELIIFSQAPYLEIERVN